MDERSDARNRDSRKSFALQQLVQTMSTALSRKTPDGEHGNPHWSREQCANIITLAPVPSGFYGDFGHRVSSSAYTPLGMISCRWPEF